MHLFGANYAVTDSRSNDGMPARSSVAEFRLRASTRRNIGRWQMSGRSEQEYLLEEALRRELAQGRIDRREFITRSLVAGLGLAGVGAVAKSGVQPAFAADRPLTPTFYQWIQDLHPGIPAVNAKFPGINYQIAPVEGFGIERFVAEAKNKRKHLGRLCRPDPVRRNVGVHQGRRHRAVGQLHPEGCDRRHHSVDPRGVHGRRQIV